MDYLLVCTVAVFASGLTLFSGFGLGTLLMPAFAMVFPVPVAIAATAVVHLANNLFKLLLLGRAARWDVVLRFGVPAAIAAVIGAGTLLSLAELPPIVTYTLRGEQFLVTPLKLVIGVLISLFALLELSGSLDRQSIPARWLPLGGLLSGFFGGLSGNQGALRSAFLIRAGLDKRAFIATSVVAAVLVDVVRLAVYGVSYLSDPLVGIDGDGIGLVAAACVAAFAGAVVGARLLHKVTLRGVQLTVSFAMIAVGMGLASGVL